MANLSMDTVKIKLAGEELKKISVEYSNIINEMYEKINNIPNSGIWKSDSDKGSASRFINSTKKDKTSSLDLANSMKSLGSKIVDYATTIEQNSQNVI